MMAEPAERFWRPTLGGLAPLLVWAGHFFLIYVLVPIGCRAGWHRASGGQQFGPLHWTLAAVTAGALAVLVVICWRAARRAHRRGGLLESFRFGAAALAILAVGWQFVPLFLFPACHFN